MDVRQAFKPVANLDRFADGQTTLTFLEGLK